MRINFLLILIVIFQLPFQAQNLIKNINLGAEGSSINHIQKATSGIVFTAYDTEGSRNLYFTNKTLEEPKILFDQTIYSPKAIGDSIFFFTFANDTVNLYLLNPCSDTTLLKSWQSNSGIGDGVGNFIKVGNLFYFLTRFTNNQLELWSTDGTPDSTKFVVDLPHNSGIRNFMELNGKIVYSLIGFGVSNDLWCYDWSTFTEFFPNPTPYFLDIIKYKNLLYFGGRTDSLGIELYYSNGTIEGTHMLKDIMLGPESSYPENFAIFDDTLYFKGSDSISGIELWKTDGTFEGTKLAADVNPGLIIPGQVTCNL